MEAQPGSADAERDADWDGAEPMDTSGLDSGSGQGMAQDASEAGSLSCGSGLEASQAALAASSVGPGAHTCGARGALGKENARHSGDSASREAEGDWRRRKKITDAVSSNFAVVSHKLDTNAAAALALELSTRGVGNAEDAAFAADAVLLGLQPRDAADLILEIGRHCDPTKSSTPAAHATALLLGTQPPPPPPPAAAAVQHGRVRSGPGVALAVESFKQGLALQEAVSLASDLTAGLAALLSSLTALARQGGAIQQARLVTRVSALFASPMLLCSILLNHDSFQKAHLGPAITALEDASSLPILHSAPPASPRPNPAGLDFDSVRALYAALASLGPRVQNGVLDASLRRCDFFAEHRELHHTAQAQAAPSFARECYNPVLAYHLIVLANPALMEPEWQPLLSRASEHLILLPAPERGIVTSTLASLGSADMDQLVAAVQQSITVQLFEQGKVSDAVQLSTKLLALLHQANRRSRVLPLSAFYNDAVNSSEFVDLLDQFRRFRHPERYAFSFFSYPFLVEPARKAHIMQRVQQKQMMQQAQEAIISAMFSRHHEIHPFNVMRIRRTHLIQDAVAHMQRNPDDIKKQLVVQFVGEEGVDEGGVKKEFFQLVVQQLFDPKFGMFSFNPDTQQFWFSVHSAGSAIAEQGMEYELIGLVLSLALYNSCILDVRLPTVVYKKLLGHKPDLTDLAQVNPGLAKGLQDLLSFSGDVEGVFQRSFQVTVEDVFGESHIVDLEPGGGSIPLTGQNRTQFVDLCVEYYLTTSVEQQFAAFAKGFKRLCGGPLLEMFEAEELELLICGTQLSDLDELEKSAVYADGYDADSRTINEFWQVVHSLTESEKRNLLMFVTGCDRVPIKGLSSLHFTISRNGPDSERLPTAHTCFNHLLLPEYADKDKLRNRLLTAINNAHGFGLR